MKNLINFTCIAVYTIVCCFAVQFVISALLKIDSFTKFVEVSFVCSVIIFLILTAGMFCYKIIREKDTF